MPTIQIVPLPGAPDFDPKTGITATRDTFAMIFEYSEEDDLGQKNMPSDTEQAVHSEWAIASGARAVMHTTESFTVYYPHQYTADPATAGPCPSACEDPTRDSDHPALAPELVPCGQIGRAHV